MLYRLLTRLFIFPAIVLLFSGMNAGRTQSDTNKTNSPPVEIVRRVQLSLVHRIAPNPDWPDANDRIGRIFLDRKRHRILVQVRRYKRYLVLVDVGRYRDEGEVTQSLLWIKGNKITPCKEWAGPIIAIQSEPELIAADFSLGLLYYVTSSGIGNGAFLHEVDRAGWAGFSSENPGHLVCLVNGRQKGRQYWGLNDWYTDVDLGGWVGEFQDGKLLKRYDVRRMPFQLLYVAATDMLLLIRYEGWQPLNGKPQAYPHITPGPQKYVSLTHFSNDSRLNVAAIDVDLTGQYLYYADRYGNTLYKIRLKDNAVVATRRLPFLVSTLAVDNDANLIYMVDWQKDALVAVKLF